MVYLCLSVVLLTVGYAYVFYSVCAARDYIKAITAYERVTSDVNIGELRFYKIRRYSKQTKLSEYISDKVLHL